MTAFVFLDAEFAEGVGLSWWRCDVSWLLSVPDLTDKAWIASN